MGEAAFPARGLELDDEEELAVAPEAITYAAPATESVAFPPRNVRPSEERAAEVPPILEAVRLGDRIALPGSPDLQALGEALHGLFAADDPGAPRSERLEIARGLLARWGVPQLDPAAALTASERLRAFVTARYPHGTPRFEWPVHAE